MSERKQYLNKAELAAELGMKKRGVEELMRARKIPFLVLGHRTVRFDWQKVQQAIARFEMKAVGQS
jgi:excisionase family DNA binding protein